MISWSWQSRKERENHFKWEGRHDIRYIQHHETRGAYLQFLQSRKKALPATGPMKTKQSWQSSTWI
jgi:hypothetical protein